MGKSITLAGLQLTEEVKHKVQAELILAYQSLQDIGIVPRLISDLFSFKSDLPKHIKMCIQMSYVEISTSTAMDLLKEAPNSLNKWHVKEELSKVKVQTVHDGLKLLYAGKLFCKIMLSS